MDLFTYALAKGGQGSGGSGITVDSVLSDQSTNPVQNKVLKAALDNKADASDVPTDTAQLTNGAGFATPQDLLTYAKKTDLNSYATTDAMAVELAAKADASAMNTAMALKANTADVTAQIAAAIGSVSSFEYYLCGNGEYDQQTGVPTVTNPDAEHIYLVPTSGTNLNMYAYIGGSFTFLGTTEVDLSSYAKSADLAAVATSGSYNDLSNKPTIPTDTGDLTNSAGYITKPRVVFLSREVSQEDIGDLGSSFVGGTWHLYFIATELTEQEYLWTVNETKQLQINIGNLPLTKQSIPNGAAYTYNCKPTETGAASGYDVDDNTKPTVGFSVFTDEQSSTGYAAFIMATENFGGITCKIYSEGEYLTEHQSLAAYATTAAMNAALADYASKSYVDSAVTGKRDTLTFDNSPTANSNNPVKSGGVYTALAGKQDTLSFDTTPTSGSPRPVKSGGIYTALAAKANAADLAAVATSGSYNDLSDTPTIPTIPTKLVTGSAKAYTIVVSDTAPSAGTADSVITIVV